MTGTAPGRHVVMTISCPHCQQKQVVQVRARAGFAQMADQTVKCVKCDKDFTVMLPDQILDGPFPE